MKKELGVLGVLLVGGLALAGAGEATATDRWQGHLRYGEVDFVPKDAFAVTLDGKPALVLADFVLDRQAIVDAFNGWESIDDQARTAKGRAVSMMQLDGSCFLRAALLNGDLRERVPFGGGFLPSEGRLQGECRGHSSPQERPVLDFDFAADLPLTVCESPRRLDLETGGQQEAVDALLDALAASDWDTARRYLPDNYVAASFPTKKMKEGFFKGLARTYPARMVLGEGLIKDSQVRAQFTGQSLRGTPIRRGSITLLKRGGTWRVLRPMFEESYKDQFPASQ